MAKGDPGGNFAGTGGYGGQFGGFGGASAGYAGSGAGNPSSVGGGTAGQTYASQQYANSLNKHNASLPNYSGGAGPNAPGNTPAAQAAYVAAKKKAAAVSPTVTAPTVTPPTEYDVSPLPPTPNPNAVNPTTGRPLTSNYSGYGSYPTYFGGHPAPAEPATGPGSGWGGMWNDVKGALGAARDWGANAAGGLVGGGVRETPRQFGGPVGPGQYTVGENGPETLNLAGGSSGAVTPNNPADRRAGLVAALQGRGGGGGGITGMPGAAGAAGAARPQPIMSAPGSGIGPTPMPRPSGVLNTGGMPPPAKTGYTGPRISGWRG